VPQRWIGWQVQVQQGNQAVQSEGETNGQVQASSSRKRLVPQTTTAVGQRERVQKQYQVRTAQNRPGDVTLFAECIECHTAAAAAAAAAAAISFTGIASSIVNASSVGQCRCGRAILLQEKATTNC